jgi:hypothetical protein
LFIVLSSLFKLGPASSAAYHSLDRYRDEWLRDEYWKGKTDRELCFICAIWNIWNNDDHWVVCVQRSVYLYQGQALTILNCCTFLSTLHSSPAWKWDSFSWINIYHRLQLSFANEDFKCLAWYWYIATLNAKDAAL